MVPLSASALSWVWLHLAMGLLLGAAIRDSEQTASPGSVAHVEPSPDLAAQEVTRQQKLSSATMKEFSHQQANLDTRSGVSGDIGMHELVIAEPSTTKDDTVARANVDTMSGVSGDIGGRVEVPVELRGACSVEGTEPLEVLGQLRKCTDALDAFAQTVKDQHKMSRDANQQYVSSFHDVMTKLQSIKDIEALNAAFSKDHAAALELLMAEAEKTKSDIAAMLPT